MEFTGSSLRSHHGYPFMAKWLTTGDEEIHGKISVASNGNAYLCQNTRNGDSTADRLGYKFSWNVGRGSRDDLKRNGLSEFKLMSPVSEALGAPFSVGQEVRVKDSVYDFAYGGRRGEGYIDGKITFVGAKEDTYKGKGFQCHVEFTCGSEYTMGSDELEPKSGTRTDIAHSFNVGDRFIVKSSVSKFRHGGYRTEPNFYKGKITSIGSQTSHGVDVEVCFDGSGSTYLVCTSELEPGGPIAEKPKVTENTFKKGDIGIILDTSVNFIVKTSASSGMIVITEKGNRETFLTHNLDKVAYRNKSHFDVVPQVGDYLEIQSMSTWASTGGYTNSPLRDLSKGDIVRVEVVDPPKHLDMGSPFIAAGVQTIDGRRYGLSINSRNSYKVTTRRKFDAQESRPSVEPPPESISDTPMSGTFLISDSAASDSILVSGISFSIGSESEPDSSGFTYADNPPDTDFSPRETDTIDDKMSFKEQPKFTLD